MPVILFQISMVRRILRLARRLAHGVGLLRSALTRLDLLPGPECLSTPMHEELEEQGHPLAILNHLNLFAHVQCLLAKVVIVTEDMPGDNELRVGKALAELHLLGLFVLVVTFVVRPLRSHLSLG